MWPGCWDPQDLATISVRAGLGTRVQPIAPARLSVARNTRDIQSWGLGTSVWTGTGWDQAMILNWGDSRTRTSEGKLLQSTPRCPSRRCLVDSNQGTDRHHSDQSCSMLWPGHIISQREKCSGPRLHRSTCPAIASRLQPGFKGKLSD